MKLKQPFMKKKQQSLNRKDQIMKQKRPFIEHERAERFRKRPLKKTGGGIIRREETQMAKNLVIYYSRKGENYVNGQLKQLEKGNTKIVSEYIREAVDADLFEIETVRDYSESYMTCIEEAREELKQDARPELKAYLPSVEQYDHIVVAGPCWWGTYPCAVLTQLEKLDFTGKKVFPVMTHEGSGMGSSAQALKKYCKGAVVGSGLAVHGADAGSSRETVLRWAKENLA